GYRPRHLARLRQQRSIRGQRLRVDLAPPLVGDREVAGGRGVVAVALGDLGGAHEARDLRGDARGRVADEVLPALLRDRALVDDAVGGALDVRPRARIEPAQLPAEDDRVGALVELQIRPVRRAVEVRVLREAAVGLLLAL